MDFEMGIEEPKRAGMVLDAALRALPESHLIHFAAADFHEERGQYVSAKAVYDEVVKKMPSPLAFILYQRFARRALVRWRVCGLWRPPFAWSEHRLSIDGRRARLRAASWQRARCLAWHESARSTAHTTCTSPRVRLLPPMPSKTALVLTTRGCWCATAMLEFHANKEPKIAHNIFELGMKQFHSEPEFILHYAEFLAFQHDDAST